MPPHRFERPQIGPRLDLVTAESPRKEHAAQSRVVQLAEQGRRNTARPLDLVRCSGDIVAKCLRARQRLVGHVHGVPPAIIADQSTCAVNGRRQSLAGSAKASC